MVNIANRQLKYEAINIQREREKKEASNNNEPPMLKLDIMSLEAPESFWLKLLNSCLLLLNFDGYWRLPP